MTAPDPLTEALERWDYDAAREFLLEQGWRLDEHAQPGPAVFSHPDGFDLVVPRTRTKADFRVRVHEMLATLSKLLRTPTDDVVRRLFRPRCDEVYFSIRGDETADGTAPIRQVLDALQSFHRALMSAATAEVTVARVQPTNPPVAAARYIRDVRVAGIERGSFRAIVLSPLTAMTEETPLLFPADPQPEQFSRRVLANLLRGTDAALAVAQSPAQLNAQEWDDRLDAHGLSANLCDALAALAESGPDEGIEIGVRPSARLATALLDARPRVVRRDLTEPLRRCANLLKQVQPVEDFTLRGRATLFARPQGELMGSIHVRAQLPEGERTVRSVVFVHDLETAFQANVRDLDVEATGRLERRGRSLWFEPRTPFREIPQKPD